MTKDEHKKIFFDFIKQHPSLSDIKYSENPVLEQEIVRLVVTDSVDRDGDNYLPLYRKTKKSIIYNKDYTVVDLNYDNLYDSFINIDFNLETVEFIKSLAVEAESKEDAAKLWLEYFVEPFIKSNVDTKTIYFVTIKDNSGWDSKPWDNTVEIQNTIEEFLEV